MDNLQRPAVGAERDRELEMVAMQIMLLLPNHNLGECLIIRDKCSAILARWLDSERRESREAIIKAVSDADMDGTNVVRLPRAD